jgi:hypothetical protein
MTAETTPDATDATDATDARLERIREGAAAADQALADWILANPERASGAGAIVVIFGNAMIRAAASEPGAMLDKLYTFTMMLDALVEYVETGTAEWEGSPWDALTALVS